MAAENNSWVPSPTDYGGELPLPEDCFPVSGLIPSLRAVPVRTIQERLKAFRPVP
jgi:hypothetical protein